jgi:hypothetical protein
MRFICIDSAKTIVHKKWALKMFLMSQYGLSLNLNLSGKCRRKRVSENRHKYTGNSMLIAAYCASKSDQPGFQAIDPKLVKESSFGHFKSHA